MQSEHTGQTAMRLKPSRGSLLDFVHPLSHIRLTAGPAQQGLCWDQRSSSFCSLYLPKKAKDVNRAREDLEVQHSAAKQFAEVTERA